MTIDITVPALGESVTEATVMRWLKAPGDAVATDEPLVELETDKVAVEVTAEAAGTLAEITAAEGTDVEVGALLGVWHPVTRRRSPPSPSPGGRSCDSMSRRRCRRRCGALSKNMDSTRRGSREPARAAGC